LKDVSRGNVPKSRGVYKVKMEPRPRPRIGPRGWTIPRKGKGRDHIRAPFGSGKPGRGMEGVKLTGGERWFLSWEQTGKLREGEPPQEVHGRPLNMAKAFERIKDKRNKSKLPL